MQNTTLCYLERDGQYLMLHRVKKAHDANKDKWIGVGGKFEDGESPEDCVLREVREETGLTLTDYRYRGLVTFVSDRWPAEYMHLFTADGWTGEMAACDEGGTGLGGQSPHPIPARLGGRQAVFPSARGKRPFLLTETGLQRRNADRRCAEWHASSESFI